MEKPWVLHSSFRDFELFAASIPGAWVSATPLRSGAFRATTIALTLGDVVLQVGRSTPVMVHGEIGPDAVWIVLPLGRPGTLVLNGRALGPRDVSIYGPNAGHSGAISHDSCWALVTLPAESFGMLLEASRLSPLHCPGGRADLRTPREVWEGFAGLARSASEVAANDPAVFDVAEARRSLRSELLVTLRELLAAGPRRSVRPRALPAKPDWHRLVRAMEDYLKLVPCRAIAVEDLCVALGEPASRLRAAVAASFSMELEPYLHIRRLAMARSALRSADPRWASVAEVASAHGFWDADVFARKYREAFAEDPALALHRGPD